MIKDNNPYLIEYNIRMGDPECQVILPRLETDLVKIIKKATENKLNEVNIRWKKEKSMTIVYCAKGYPGKYRSNIKLYNIKKLRLSNKEFIYHAGTKFLNGHLLSNGGRIFSVTVLGKKFYKIRSSIISILKKLNLKQGFFRKDIGWKIIK